MATRAHAHQVRQGSGLPYIVHPARVVTTLRDVGVTDADILAAAWLHDVVEDTRQTLHDVRVCVGDRAACLVGLLTKVSPFDPTPYFGAIWADEDATAIKLADRLDNVREVHLRGPAVAIRYLMETERWFTLSSSARRPVVALCAALRSAELDLARWIDFHRDL